MGTYNSTQQIRCLGKLQRIRNDRHRLNFEAWVIFKYLRKIGNHNTVTSKWKKNIA